MSKLVLDTNVLIYGLDSQSSFNASAANILSSPTYDLYVPTKVITEFFAVCSKLKLSTADAINFYEEIKKNTSLLYPNPSSLSHFEQLFIKYQPRGNRVFDLEIVSVALANNIPMIATANLNDFQGVNEITVFPITGIRPSE